MKKPWSLVLAAAIVLAVLGWNPAFATTIAFGPLRVLRLEQGARGIAVGDFNEDGLADIAAAYNVGAFPNNTSRFAVFLAQPGGTFSAPTIYDPGVGCWTGGGTFSAAIEVADVNGDGHLDIIMAHGGTNSACVGDKITVHLGDGTGSFASPGLLFTTTEGVWARLAIADFDEDGHLDIVASGASLVMHRGHGDGTFGAGVTIPTGGPGIVAGVPYDLVVGDFNGDGHADLAGADFSFLQVKVLLGSGAGSFSVPIVVAFSGPNGVASADFDEDGVLDLAVVRVVPGQVGLFTGVGNGTLASPITFPIADFSKSVVAEDFDRDGHVDLAIGSFRGTITVLPGDGTGAFGPAITLAALQGAGDRVRTADFDGDGQPDLAATCFGVCVFLNQTILTVAIDIKPGSVPNSINPRSRGRIPVAILSTAAFDAPGEVDRASLTFGRTGDEPSLAFCSGSPEDVDGDGLLDLVCHFDTQVSGFQAGDTRGILKGRTLSERGVTGSDTVRIVPSR